MTARLGVVLVAVVVAAVLGGCERAPNSLSDQRPSVVRWTDPDYRVTCWITWRGVAIDCLPESEVKPR